MTKEESLAIFKIVDTNNSGTISIDEFKRIFDWAKIKNNDKTIYLSIYVFIINLKLIKYKKNPTFHLNFGWFNY